MRLPLILVNFKTYDESTGENGLKLAKTCEAVSEKYKINISVAPAIFDLSEIVRNVKIPVFAQHIDPIMKNGKQTGHILAENVKKIGAAGTILNHSEKRLGIKDIAKCILVARSYDLTTVCCSENPKESAEIAKFGPDFIAIEPPELIGSGVSVSTAKPKVVEKAVKEIHKINPRVKALCGAGITTGEDIKKAVKLGTVGVLLASGVVKAKDPREVLIDFAKAVKH